MNTENKIARHVAAVPPSGIRKFFDIASEMKDAISLGVGEPDFVTPWNIREAAIYSLERGKTHYTSNHGLPELRELINEYMRVRFGVTYHLPETFVTVGASEALDLAFRALIEPGDEVLIPAPSYVSYMPGVTFCGGVPIAMKTREEDQFKLTPDLIESAVTEKTKLIVVPYPNNPTGATMSKEDYLKITEVIRKHDLIVLADDIYAELTYGGDHACIAAIEDMAERTIVINGFSKAFAMTGWRLGYACGPKPVIDAMVKIHQYSMLCAPIMSQVAGVEALRFEMETDFKQVKQMQRDYDRRRQLIYEGLKEIGLTCFEPKGAFYIFPNISSTGMDSETFCEQLIREKRVACVPGTAFGSGGENFIRCSYASSIENITEALKRMGQFIKEHE